VSELKGGESLEAQGGIVRWSRIGLIGASWLYAACIAVQVFLAGLSIFDAASHWSDHTSFGQSIGIVPVLMLLLALVGRTSVVSIILSAAVFLLYGLQYAFANTDNGSVAALHAVNALLMFWLTTIIAQQGLRLVRTVRMA
jgi:hypothetical protein